MAQAINWLGRALGLVCAASPRGRLGVRALGAVGGRPDGHGNQRRHGVTARRVGRFRRHCRRARPRARDCVAVSRLVLSRRCVFAADGSLAEVGRLDRSRVARRRHPDLDDEAPRTRGGVERDCERPAPALEWQRISKVESRSEWMRSLWRAVLLVGVATWLAACAPGSRLRALVRADARQAARRLDGQRSARVRA